MTFNKTFSTIIIFVVALVVALLFVFPKYKESSSLENKLAQNQAKYDADVEYYAKIASLSKDIDDKKDLLEKINIALPTDSSLAPLVYFFQKKGAESGLVVKSVVMTKNSSLADNKEIKDIIFTLNVLGNYQGLKNFLASLETSARLFEVNAIAFKSPVASQDANKSKNQQQVYDFQLEVETHSY